MLRLKKITIFAESEYKEVAFGITPKRIYKI